ncbi:MAG: tRNA (adenosine(37)-N6)-dimethylallyltransferase MiaA [Bacteroidales bacterium]|nr:tRNA (adenosine(37)-N6)-dimethylallyltransferase MiaA [Bacteroidales bacterium]
MSRDLLIVLGPTCVGKTDYSIGLAKFYSSPVISCDSRQIYKEMRIGTAVPSASQLAAVRHYFIQDHSIHSLYTAGKYEIEALSLMDRLWNEGHRTLVMTGGSMFYIDAVCNGLDDMPDADPSLREELTRRMKEEGVDSLRMDLKRLDPEAYSTIDIANPQRVLRAVEVCLLSGRTFSSFKLSGAKPRDFTVKKIGLRRNRDELYDRIGVRVEAMMEEGLLSEAEGLYPLRHLTALQTVGYRELFSYMDGECTLEKSVEDIKTNTRHYAKRQLTWWKRDESIEWIDL